jgi:hypothetical protein
MVSLLGPSFLNCRGSWRCCGLRCFAQVMVLRLVAGVERANGPADHMPRVFPPLLLRTAAGPLQATGLDA